MADNSSISSVLNSAVESIQNLPASLHSVAGASPSHPRLFNRDKSVHQLLGGGKAADLLLWRKRNTTFGVFAAVSGAYFLFEWSGLTFISIISHALLFVIVILFLWSSAASILNRPPPPIPEIVLQEHVVHQAASKLHVEINKILALAHDVAIGKDYKLFLKVVIALWISSVVGGWCSLLTLLYIGFVAVHALPIFYEKYENDIDRHMHFLFTKAKNLYVLFDERLLSKIPRGAQKKKKAL